jgi:biopolymer transport protein ExbD
MRIRDVQGEAEEPFNLVPLRDMAFNLLIFFMAATSFTQIEKDLRVQLPRVAATQRSTTAPPRQLIINIKQDGSTTVVGKRYTPEELAKFVQAQLKADPKRPVLIRADERGMMKYFAEVALLCHRAGASELRIGLLQEPSPTAP